MINDKKELNLFIELRYLYMNNPEHVQPQFGVINIERFQRLFVFQNCIFIFSPMLKRFILLTRPEFKMLLCTSGS